MLALEARRAALQLVGELYCEIRAVQEFLRETQSTPEEFGTWADRARVLSSRCLMLEGLFPCDMPLDLSESLDQLHGVCLGLRQLREATQARREGAGRTEWSTATWATYQETLNKARALATAVRMEFDAWAWGHVAPALHAGKPVEPGD
jgi:hypothetical protein